MGEMHMRQISEVHVIVRIDGAPGATIELLRQRLMAHGDLFRLESLERVDTRVWGRLAQPRFYSGVFAAVAAVALLLATIGIYGVLSYAVTRRTHDVGVRMTLGASAGDVLRLVMRRGVAVTALGVTFGLAGSLVLTRSLASLLYGVPSTDPLTYATVAALVSAVALLACWLPARRAVRIDPMEALRCR
jgi:putative ABC transport system permease protein